MKKGEIEKKRRKIKEEKVENWNWKKEKRSYKMRRGLFLGGFGFHFWKPLKFVLGLPKWEFSTRKKHFMWGYSSLVLVGMCPAELESRPIQIPIFKKEWPIHIQMGPILSKIAQFFQNCLKFEPILAQIWQKLWKTTQSYTKFCILWGFIHIPRGWFCYPYWQHIPVGSFVLSTPSPGLYFITMY